jgi:hypothetical protein
LRDWLHGIGSHEHIPIREEDKGTVMLLKNGLLAAFAFVQSTAMVWAGEGAPPPEPVPPAAGGDSGNDAAIILVVLLGALILAANGMKHGAAPVVACDDEDDNGECDDNAPQN